MQQLRDENTRPDPQTIAGALGSSWPAYEKLAAEISRPPFNITFEWRWYNDGKAWLCKVQKKKRTIAWMSAWKGYMQASMYFPEKYLDDVFALDIGEATIAKIKSTKNTGKSRPCIFEIRDAAVLEDFDKVCSSR